MSDPTTFGDHIRAARVEAGLGLRAAAQSLEISASYLSRLETDDLRPPSGVLLLRMSRLYRTDITKLMDLARGRTGEVIAADPDVAPVVQAFYRLAHDQSPEVQERMIMGALDALDLPPDKRLDFANQLRNIIERARGRDLPRRARGRDTLFAFDIAPRFHSRRTLRAMAQSVLRNNFPGRTPVPVPIEALCEVVEKDIVLVVEDQIDGGRLPDGGPAVLGLSRWSRDGLRRELVIHEHLFEAPNAPTRRRANFTLAHELFHCLEHLPLVQAYNPQLPLATRTAHVTLAPRLARRPCNGRTPGPRRLCTQEDWREWQANTFAAELLMPAESVAAAFNEIFGDDRRPSGDQDPGDLARATAIDDLGNYTSLADRFDVNPQAMAIRLITLGLVQHPEEP